MHPYLVRRFGYEVGKRRSLGHVPHQDCAARGGAEGAVEQNDGRPVLVTLKDTPANE
jgi:hypothetical protein